MGNHDDSTAISNVHSESEVHHRFVDRGRPAAAASTGTESSPQSKPFEIFKAGSTASQDCCSSSIALLRKPTKPFESRSARSIVEPGVTSESDRVPEAESWPGTKKQAQLVLPVCRTDRFHQIASFLGATNCLKLRQLSVDHRAHGVRPFEEGGLRKKAMARTLNRFLTRHRPNKTWNDLIDILQCHCCSERCRLNEADLSNLKLFI